MSSIDDEPSARRLARAIAADIQLYNQETLEAGGDLSAEIEEGRQLFRSRVTPGLHPVYDEEIASLRTRSEPSAAAPPPPPRPAPPTDRFASFHEAPVASAETGGRGALALVVGLLVVVAAIVVLWLKS